MQLKTNSSREARGDDVIEIKSEPYFTCNNCDSTEHFTLGHLTSGKAGPWRCDCGRVFWIQAKEGPTYEVTHEDGSNSASVPELILLKMQPVKEVYLLVRGLISGQVKDWGEHESHQRYYYEEHTCPTNILGNAQVIMADGDDDFHGLFEYVGRAPWKNNASREDIESILESKPN